MVTLLGTGLLGMTLGCVAETPDDDDFDYEFIEVGQRAPIDPAIAPNPETSATPRLRLLLTDAPADVDAVFVTFSEASVQSCSPPEDAEPDDEDGDCPSESWMPVMEEDITFDLLTLQGGVTAELGIADLPPGDYGQLRLTLVEASVVVEQQELPVTVPSGTIKLNGGFELENGMQTELVIDFDADHSLHYNPGQGWMMSPVISLISETVVPVDDPDPDPEG